MTIRSTQRVTAGAELVATPVLSRDGTRLAYTMARGTVRLWTFPFDSANGRVAGDGQAITEGGLYVRTSSLSYDGSRLAYVADRAGTAKMEFWMTDLTGGNHRQLTDDDHARFTPQWSRDGRTLAYGWSERPGTGKSRQALAIRSMDSQEEQLISTPQLVAGWAAAPYDWSLDGRSILASSVVPHPPVHSLTLWPLAAAPRAETALTTLAYDPHYDLWQARYSPDGKWICFVASEREITGGNTIFVMPSSGGERSQWTSLTDSREWADKPRWSRMERSFISSDHPSTNDDDNQSGDNRRTSPSARNTRRKTPNSPQLILPPAPRVVVSAGRRLTVPQPSCGRSD
jgi:Tol biopolymer transport system component